MEIVRHLFLFCLGLLFHAAAWAVPAESAPLRVAVVDDVPPMGFRDGAGKLTGFNVSLMQAICAELNVRCDFQAAPFESLVDELSAGTFDVAAVGLLNTPERQQKILFSRPVYRSQTLVFAPLGVYLGQPGIRVSTLRGSAQERYLRQQGWSFLGAKNYDEIIVQLSAGVTQACIVSLTMGIHLQKNSQLQRLGLRATVLRVPELENSAAFGVSPQRADLKESLDKALEKVKLNGVFDRINSRFLPFRID